MASTSNIFSGKPQSLKTYLHGLAVVIFWCALPVAAITDPTSPLGGSAEPEFKQESEVAVVVPVPQLESIICMSTCRAVIAGQAVKAGGSVNGYRVTAIKPSEVILRREQQTFNLELFPNDIKQ
ncbi:hypothetical protein [Thaumasiovibrio subtropicus]|uniref:hypothetical protein n=1 Tax=Thaumasiovibrio subtropicus TaxID=1891207 RepID=UPI000B357467|nr:hypothetical protein [Thaumasiovibrio subtropicus]